MKKIKHDLYKKELHDKAVEFINKNPAAIKEVSSDEIKCLVQDLQIHQVELEMLNEELRRAQQELEAARDKYSDLYDFAPIGYFTIDSKGIILEVNLTGTGLMGVERRFLIGMPLTRFITKEDLHTFYLHQKQVDKENIIEHCELKMMNHDNIPFYAKLQSIAVHGEDGDIVKIRTAMTDISVRKKIEQQLRTSLKEKEVLLQEVHHRVKNNMQVITSLIDLQCEKIEDKHICDMFLKTVDRINSMALVHKQLYTSNDFSKVDITSYMKSLAENLFKSHSVDTDKISLKIGKTDVALNLDSAIICGLIINELITNCLKHAFPGDRNGEVQVAFESLDDGQLEMRVSDDGVGLPSNFDFRNSDTLGVKMVIALAEYQLGGTINLDSTRGTEFKVRFKATPLKVIV